MRMLVSAVVLFSMCLVLAAQDDKEKTFYESVDKVGKIPGEGVLTAKDFSKDQVHETEKHWGWHRSAGRGGKNYGGDFVVPKDRVLVGWEASVKSKHRTKGNIDWKIVYSRNKGGILVPVGVHTGIRLTPDDGNFDLRGLESFAKFSTTPSKWTTNDIKKLVGTGGAAFHGQFKLKYVTKKDWKKKWAEKNL